MNRRHLFLLGTGRSRVLEVSCERLYMKYVDSRTDGTTEQLLQRIREQAQQAYKIRFREPYWLDREDFRRVLAPLLTEFCSRGCEVEYA